MPIRNNEKLEPVKASLRFEKYANIDCWVERRNNFDTHIFTIILENQEHLEELWGIINRDIALYFQAKLPKDIERWNIYIIFFVNQEVSISVKYTIEQDKYCARKIVIDNFQKPDNYEAFILETLNDKLFDLKVKSEDVDPNSEAGLPGIIKNISEDLYKIVTDDNYDKDKAIEHYLGGDICNETQEN